MFADWFYLLPDWLNLIGSIIYLCSACMYPYQFDASGDKTDWFTTVQLLEVEPSCALCSFYVHLLH